MGFLLFVGAGFSQDKGGEREIGGINERERHNPVDWNDYWDGDGLLVCLVEDAKGLYYQAPASNDKPGVERG